MESFPQDFRSKKKNLKEDAVLLRFKAIISVTFQWDFPIAQPVESNLFKWGSS